jgi:hypothetical protein
MRRAIGEANRASALSGPAARHRNVRAKDGLCPSFAPYQVLVQAPLCVNQHLRCSSRKTTAFSPDCSTTSK